VKKNDMRFSISFNPEIPKHQKAAEILNAAGRRKASVIANALDALQECVTDGVPSPGIDDDGYPQAELSHDEGLRDSHELTDSILSNISGFRG
jgi:hypothetical protein